MSCSKISQKKYKHIKLIDQGKDLTKVFDGSQTVSVGGEVENFILCAPFDQKGEEDMKCYIEYSFTLLPETGGAMSGSGK